jgi:NitT/TauT family transport system substrate-binding protein
MGCIVANKNFVSKNKNLIKSFLEEYENSIEFISNPDNVNESAKYVVAAGIMEKEPPAKKAILNLGDQIAFVDGSKMKKSLETFYTAIGVDLPDEAFYYNAK